MRQLRNAIRHVFNPLHVYCRLSDFGLPKPVARTVCRAYERFVFRLFV